jgi:hypothetical protein
MMLPPPPRFLVRLVLVATFGAATAPVGLPAGNRDLPTGAYRVQPAQIIDRTGFEKPMTAVNLVIPMGWKTSGGVVWNQAMNECGPVGTHFQWRADAPDGISAIEILPDEKWSGHNLNFPGMPQQQCPNITITNVRDYLQWYVQRVRPNARILDYRERPDFVASMAMMNRTDTSFGGEMKSWVEGGEVLLGYQHQGRDVRETIGLGVLFMQNRMPGLNPGEVMQSLSLYAMPAYAVRAPNGQYDFQLAELIRRSIQRDPEWGRRMDEHNRRITEINRKGAQDRHRITMDAQREIAEIRQQTYENQQASQDRRHEEFSQVIRGVDTYVDSSSNERVELPNTHNYVWRLNDDSYILTNDVNFQPGRDLGVDGRQLETAP